MQSRNFRDNVLAGLFVVSGLAIAVWGSFLIGGQGSGRGLNFDVRFSLKEGATGLKQGSEVLLGGLQVGQVKSVKHEIVDGIPQSVMVNVEVDGSLTLYQNASIVLERPLLGTLSSINIISAGESSVQKIVDATTVDGNLAPPAFLAQAGIGEKQVSSIQTILSNAESTSKSLDQFFGDGGRADKIMQGIENVLANISPNAEQWSKDVTAGLAGFSDAGDSLPKIRDNVNSLIDGGKDVVKSAQDIINENRADLKETVTSAKNIAAKIDEKTINQFHEVLKIVQTGVADFQSVARTADELIKEGRGDVQNTLRELSLGAQEMRFAIAEIRAQPWRVMHTPSLKERETEDLYAAAHAYARAAAQLRSTSDSIAGLLRDDSISEAGKASLAKLKEQLERDVENHRAAGRTLMDELLEPR